MEQQIDDMVYELYGPDTGGERCGGGAVGVYFFTVLNISNFIKSTQASNTLPIINKTEFSKFSILVPSLQEQQKIASFLSEIDKKIESINIEIESSEK